MQFAKGKKVYVRDTPANCGYGVIGSETPEFTNFTKKKEELLGLGAENCY